MYLAIPVSCVPQRPDVKPPNTIRAIRQFIRVHGDVCGKTEDDAVRLTDGIASVGSGALRELRPRRMFRLRPDAGRYYVEWGRYTGVGTRTWLPIGALGVARHLTTQEGSTVAPVTRDTPEDTP